MLMFFQYPWMGTFAESVSMTGKSTVLITSSKRNVKSPEEDRGLEMYSYDLA